MGIFTFLKKKHDGTAPTRTDGPATRLSLDKEAERERQREIARATAAKIDEIELEMVSDIFDDDAWTSPRRPPAVAAAAVSQVLTAAPELDPDTDLLLGPEAALDADLASAAPAVEEAAILYANGELEAAEHSLLAILAGAGRSDRLPWWMLFDLYQAASREQDFDSIAIDYASHFETSPPPYSPLFQARPESAGHSAPAAFSGATPTARLSGPLDDRTAAQLAHVLAPSASPLVRLDFSATTAATSAGCQSLLEALQSLRRAGRELVLAGAEHLLAVLRPMLAIGDRSAGQAPWLLLLELLLLAKREKDFEETAMDFCVTFEVSPPSFEAPARAAVKADASAPIPARAGTDDHFLLPGVVEGDSTSLLAAIETHAERCRHLVLDCSRLARIDYTAATALLARLRKLADADIGVELRDVNHLVAALLRLLGLGPPARLGTHKY